MKSTKKSPDAMNIESWRQAFADRHTDPYLVWTVLTRFRQFVDKNNKLPGDIDFLVELDKPYNGDAAAIWPPKLLKRKRRLWTPKEYECPLPGSDKTSRFITVRLPAENERPEDVVPYVLLLLTANVKRIQIGFPRPPVHVDPDGPAEIKARTWPVPPPAVLLGLLDDTCPFGHPALSEGPQAGSRVWFLWDQTDNQDNKPPPPAHMGYGTQLPKAMLLKLLNEHTHGGCVDDEALYQDGNAHQPRLRRRSSHAAAVVGLMAGMRSALPTAPLPGWLSDAVAGGDAPEGVMPRLTEEDAASRAPLVVVQLPNEELGVQLARWLAVRALDGLRYIARASAQMAGGDKSPVPLVVNISYGSIMGAHDGTAMLESAMDELLAAHSQMAIVLAAGNSYGRQRRNEDEDVMGARVPSGRHAQCTVGPKPGKARLGLYLPPDKSIESHLEVWLDRQDANDPYLHPGDIKVTLTPPAGAGLPPVTAPCPGIMLGPNDIKPIYGLFVLPRAAQSTRQSLVSLSVAATRMSATDPEEPWAPSGLWTLEICNKSRNELKLDAWVERDILPGKARRQQAARLVKLEGEDAANLTDENTLNNIATGERTFRAGALEAQCDKEGLQVSPYSSAPADGARGLEFSAIADTSVVLPGIRVSGSTGGTTVRMNGTSLAAPQAARWIANKLALRKSMSDIRKEIEPEAGPAAPTKPAVPDRQGQMQRPPDPRRRGKLRV